MLKPIPRIIIAALKGGSGKTIFSLGLISAWREKGLEVAPFKKGPDFIDSSWLSFAGGRSCHNLDPFLMTRDQVLQSLLSHSAGMDISLIEGNRGLFDGLDIEGCCSTAELAKWIMTPVVIIADVSMTTRTVAAQILGCQLFDPAINITGVILNRVAGSRQENLVRNTIEKYCGIPVLGAVPRLKENIFPERHMGLVPYQEREHAEKAINWARSLVEDNIDLDLVFDLASKATSMDRAEAHSKEGIPDIAAPDPPRIGYIKDSAFWFYYPENLDRLGDLGAEVVEINSVSDRNLPELDALYIGGGFPETRAELLAENRSFRDSIKNMILAGLPVYAECGGLIYLGEALHINEDVFPMVGALPLRFLMDKKPQGHGYSILEADHENPYWNVGEIIKGHEFHYSKPVITRPQDINLVFKVQRGQGIDGKRDGIIKNNLLATYSHIHGGGNPVWGERFFQAALRYQASRKKNV